MKIKSFLNRRTIFGVKIPYLEFSVTFSDGNGATGPLLFIISKYYSKVMLKQF